MDLDLDRIVIDEMPDPVIRDAPQLRPFAERAHRRLLAGREYPAPTEPENIRESVFDERIWWRVYTLRGVSTEGFKPQLAGPEPA